MVLRLRLNHERHWNVLLLVVGDLLLEDGCLSELLLDGVLNVFLRGFLHERVVALVEGLLGLHSHHLSQVLLLLFVPLLCHVAKVKTAFEG